MPHTNRKAVQNNGFVPAQFVNTSLDDDVKAKIKEAPWDIEAFNNAMVKLMSDGYKLTVRYDAKNDCFAAWLVAPPNGSNKGYILAGRGSTPFKAVKQVSYIHFVVYDGDWSEGVVRSVEAVDD